MRQVRGSLVRAIGCTAAVTATAFHVNTFAQTTERVSVSTSEVEANGLNGTTLAISGDGRYIAFESAASNLVSADTNSAGDVFVRDRVLGITERVSVSSSSAQANGRSRAASISSDGRYVAFHSLATNLVTGDTNAVGDVFLRDRQLGTTVRVSLSNSGAQATGASDAATSVSADGRYVAFASVATNLVTGDTNTKNDVFVRDRVAGTTRLVSMSTSNALGNGDSGSPSISADGRYVAFGSFATNLASGAPAGTHAVYLRDLTLLTTESVSRNLSGGISAGAITSNSCTIAGGGRYVIFSSEAGNLAAGDTNANYDVFVRDRTTGTNEIASVSSSGGQSNATLETAMLCSLSADGRYVAFTSRGSNLVSGDGNGMLDVFVRDRFLHTTVRASLTQYGGQANGLSGFGLYACSMSADGRNVAFLSGATNLITGDVNSVDDVFVRDRGPLGAFTAYCLGDGTGTLCPCANAGSTGNGCENSFATGGAHLGASGNASVSSDSVLLLGSGMPPTSSAIYFQGSSQSNGNLGVVFGDGLRCTAGSVLRLGARINADGASSYGRAGDVPVSVRGLVPAAGGAFYYQVWYRNNVSYCSPSAFNLSNGLMIVWGA